LFFIIAALVCSEAHSPPPLQPNHKPNFIVIITDDQGWDDIGLNNPRYAKTPNLDKFIKGGMLFDNFYVTPQCAQTRASLLTGRSSARVGVMRTNSGVGLLVFGLLVVGCAA
jgi:arylsulfatase